ncbi:MAG: DUF5671 domain-containing protein [Dehalococcoidia bacterium]|nr:DUF5671 domain-containing protein [Dehalococcoidia bacterium]
MSPDDVFRFVQVLLVIAGVGLVIAGIIYALQRARSGQGFAISLRQLFTVYLYVMTILTLLLTVSGLSHLVQAGLAVPMGKEFSYYPRFMSVRMPPPYQVPAKPGIMPEQTQLTPEEQARLQEEEARRRKEGLELAHQEGLLNGLSLSVVGGILWALHQWGRRRLAEKESLMERLYLIVLLFIFAAMSLSSLPSSISETVRFYVVRTPEEIYNPPGGKLATAIVTLPFWIYYLACTIRRLRRTPGA